MSANDALHTAECDPEFGCDETCTAPLASEATVDRVARALYGAEARLGIPWEELPEMVRDQWHKLANAAIGAMLDGPR